MYGQWYDHSWMMGGGMLIAWIWMGLLILIPLFVLFLVIKNLFGKNRDRSDQVYPDPEYPGTLTPLDILKSSYARGEISRDEFLQKRDDILEK